MNKKADRDKRREERAEARRKRREQAVAKITERAKLLLAKAQRWKWLSVFISIVAAIGLAIYLKGCGI
mgnify:CR=1 FL=1